MHFFVQVTKTNRPYSATFNDLISAVQSFLPEAKHNLWWFSIKIEFQVKMTLSLRSNWFLTYFLALCLISKSCCAEDLIIDGTCEKDSCATDAPPKPKCRIFDPKNFGPKNRTILYGDAHGRISNQLLGEITGVLGCSKTSYRNYVS